MVEIPQAAFDAATAKLMQRYGIPPAQLDAETVDRDIKAVLGAALPYIVAAARAEWEAEYPDG